MAATSLHDELRYMVEAGMSEGDVLRAATGSAAELLGLGERGVRNRPCYKRMGV